LPSPPPTLRLEPQDEQGLDPERLKSDPESETMFAHRSTPSVAEAAGTFPAAVCALCIEDAGRKSHASACGPGISGKFRAVERSWISAGNAAADTGSTRRSGLFSPTSTRQQVGTFWLWYDKARNGPCGPERLWWERQCHRRPAAVQAEIRMRQRDGTARSAGEGPRSPSGVPLPVSRLPSYPLAVEQRE